MGGKVVDGKISPFREKKNSEGRSGEKGEEGNEKKKRRLRPWGGGRKVAPHKGKKKVNGRVKRGWGRPRKEKEIQRPEGRRKKKATPKGVSP